MQQLMQWGLLLLMVLACPVKAADSDEIFTLRSQAYAFMSHLIAYFDPYEKYPVPESRIAYQSALQRLEKVPANRQIRIAVEHLRELTLELEKQPLDQVQRSYPQWINPLLEEHAQLERLAGQLKDSSDPSSGAIGKLQQLSLLNSQILLLYQTRAAQLYAMHVDFSEEGFELLDAQIMQAFAELQAQYEPWREPLGKLLRDYEFVRPSIVDGGRRAVTGSVGFYLGRILLGLDDLQSSPMLGKAPSMGRSNFARQ